MSNILKAGTYSQGEKPVILTLQVPLIDTGCTSEQKVIKMREELDELLNEFCNGPVHIQRSSEELMDVIQAMAGFLLAANREMLPNINPIERVKNQFDIASAVHMQKMKFRAVERNWQLIYE